LELATVKNEPGEILATDDVSAFSKKARESAEWRLAQFEKAVPGHLSAREIEQAKSMRDSILESSHCCVLVRRIRWE
jgi:hypothetical protein